MSARGVSPDQFRTLLGRFATGVTVLVARDAASQPIGMTASSIASTSLEPPLLLVCVERRHEMHAAMATASHFGLNILAADQEAISRRFAEDAPDRFHEVAYTESALGGKLPVLDGVVAYIECHKHAAVPAGDHTVYVGLVIGGQHTDRPPLLYYRSEYRALGERDAGSETR